MWLFAAKILIAAEDSSTASNLSVTWILLVMALIAIICLLVFLFQKSTKKPEENDYVKKEKLAKNYCEIAKKVERFKAEEVYKKYFSMAAPAYQTLLGTSRRYYSEGMSDAELLNDLDVALKNAGLTRMLTETGFNVSVQSLSFDRASTLKKCLERDIKTLETELEKQKMFLKQFKEQLDCKQIVEQTGKLLFFILQEIRRENTSECLKYIAQLGRKLEDNGCYAVYVDDPLVSNSELMRRHFRDDLPTATELPGLYSRDAVGNYYLIGTFGGTMRVEEK